jgi:hypothetical protein
MSYEKMSINQKITRRGFLKKRIFDIAVSENPNFPKNLFQLSKMNYPFHLKIYKYWWWA